MTDYQFGLIAGLCFGSAFLNSVLTIIVVKLHTEILKIRELTRGNGESKARELDIPQWLPCGVACPTNPHWQCHEVAGHHGVHRYGAIRWE